MLSGTLFLLTAESVLADIDNAFSVLKDAEFYSAKPGEKIIITFSIANNKLVAPKSVIAYIDPCPVSWECEEPEFSFAEKNKRNEANITIKIPQTAIPKKYTLFIKLRSNEAVLRGDDRIVITVASDKEDEIITYDEYLAKKKADEKRRTEGIKEPEKKETENKLKETEIANKLKETESEEKNKTSESNRIVNTSEIIENVERLESSKQFIDYATILLIILLIFVAAGAYITYSKNKLNK
jgi:hypothetical protein